MAKQQLGTEPETPVASDAAGPAPDAQPQAAQTVPAAPPELRYQGDASGELHISGIPADDLWPEQIDHIVLQRSANRENATDADGNPIPRVMDPGLAPGDKGFKKARADVVDELVASGIYAKE